MKKLPVAGETIARTMYVRVLGTKWDLGGTALKGVDLGDGEPLQVQGDDLIKTFDSAEQYDVEEPVTRTELAQKLVGAGARPFTVCFVKANREERELVGHLIEHEDLMGRSMVRDLGAASGPGTEFRQIDHRTLRWLILGGVRYYVKGK